MNRTISWVFVLLLSLSVIATAQPPSSAVKFDSETISGLGARNIGSAQMSGRIAALDAVPEGNRLTIYLGSASGGVWKSVNGGTTYKPVFDKQPVQSIGAVTIDPRNAQVVWVGTGEEHRVSACQAVGATLASLRRLDERRCSGCRREPDLGPLRRPFRKAKSLCRNHIILDKPSAVS
jgi:hypothetical protein